MELTIVSKHSAGMAHFGEAANHSALEQAGVKTKEHPHRPHSPTHHHQGRGSVVARILANSGYNRLANTYQARDPSIEAHLVQTAGGSEKQWLTDSVPRPHSQQRPRLALRDRIARYAS